MPSPPPVRFGRGASGGWLLFVGGLALLALPYGVFPREQVVGRFREYDLAWQVDLVGQLADGRWSGRDFSFNFGVTHQLAHALGLALPPGDMASVMRWYDLPGTLLVLVALWGVLATSGAALRERAMLFAAWLACLAVPGEFKATAIKPMLALAPVIAGGLAVGGAWPELPGWRRLVGWASWLVAPAVLSNYSFELGILTLAALGLGAAVTAAITLGWSGPAARGLRLRAVGGLIWGLIGAAAFLAPGAVSPTWRRYLVESWALSQSYQTAWAWPGRPAELLLLGLPLAGAVVVGVCVVRELRRQLVADEPSDPRLVALGTAALFAASLVRYGITRSDLFHLWPALAPGTFLAGVWLPGYLLARRQANAVRAAPPIDAVAPAPGGSPATIPGTWQPWALALAVMLPYVLTSTWRAGWQLKLAALAQFDPRPARIEFADAGWEAACRAAAQLAGDELLVWPYGGQINRWASKGNPCYSILPTEAHNHYLVQGTLNRLEAAPDTPVLVYRQAIAADGISNLVRTSSLVGWLLEHRQLAGEPEASHALLRRRPSSNPWEITPLVEPATSPQFVPGGGRALALPLTIREARASDLIRLRLRASRTSLWGCRKPGHTVVVLVVAGAEPVYRPVPLPMDGEPHEYLLSAIDLEHPLFLTHWSPNRAWRSRERLGAIQVGWQAMDALSRAPAQITLEAAEVLRPVGREWLETSLAEATRPEVARWCYAGGPRPRWAAPATDR